MSNDGFTHALGLGLRGPERLELLESNEAAGELERQMSRVSVRRHRGDVVIQTRQSPRFEEAVSVHRNPVGEVLSDHGVSCGLSAAVEGTVSSTPG